MTNDTVLMSDSLADILPGLDKEKEEQFRGSFVLTHVTIEGIETVGSLLGAETTQHSLKIDMRVLTSTGLTVLLNNLKRAKSPASVTLDNDDESQIIDCNFIVESVKLIDIDPVEKMCTLCIDLVKV